MLNLQSSSLTLLKGGGYGHTVPDTAAGVDSPLSNSAGRETGKLERSSAEKHLGVLNISQQRALAVAILQGAY